MSTHAPGIDPYLVEIVVGRIKMAEGSLLKAYRKIREENWPALATMTRDERKELLRLSCIKAKAIR